MSLIPLKDSDDVITRDFKIVAHAIRSAKNALNTKDARQAKAWGELDRAEAHLMGLATIMTK